MSEVKNITDEELSAVKELRDKIIGVISTVGQLKLTMDLLKEETKELENKSVSYTHLTLPTNREV